jgi:hypothetical protein
MLITIIKNANTMFLVKLNDTGRKIERQYLHEMYKSSSLLIDPKKEDEQGHTQWPMWEFMSVFGGYCYNGADVFFEEVVISSKDPFTQYCSG